MRALQGHPDLDVSSTVTKRNPRPRKYASASERQAAYRARAPELCFRAESKTADTLDKIAADLDVSRADLLLSMTKFALTNHDWARFGLTHRPLPYQYGVEQEARTNPVPIWDRPRPKKLGPSVPLTAAQKRKAKALAAAAGRSYPNLVDNIAASRNPSMKQPTPAQIAARERFSEMARSGAFKRKAKAKSNPRKKTVSQKISQLMHEGYPQKQAVAVALSEQRAGKVKRNPISQVAQTIYEQLGGNRFAVMTGAKNFVGGENTLQFSIPRNASPFNKLLITYVPERDLYSMKFLSRSRHRVYDDVYAEQLRDIFTSETGLYTSLGTMGRQRNPATGHKGSHVKLNPTVAKLYTVSRADAMGQPVYHIAHFRKLAEAKAYAQAYADANKTRVAITSKAL